MPKKTETHAGLRKAMEVIIIVMYGLALIPFFGWYYILWFWIATAAAIVAFVLSKQANDDYVANKDLLNIIFSVVAIVPIVGFVLKILGIIFASQALKRIE